MKNLFKHALCKVRTRAPLVLVHVQGAPLYIWRHRVLAALLLVVCVSGAEFVFLKIPKAQAAYTVSNSARFVSGSSDYLNRTFSAGNQKTFTYSVWFKRGPQATDYATLFGGANGAGSGWELFFKSGETLEISDYTGPLLTTNALFRDPAAWYHVVMAVDTTQATAANRVKLYINGQQITAFSADNVAARVTQNLDTYIDSAAEHRIGRVGTGFGSIYYNGYMSDAYFVDGQQLTPTSFGAYDTNGYWRPAAYTGTYGTNGFHLTFGNGAALGTDSSGNGNTWTVNGLTAADQVVDTPSNNYATFSPVDNGGGCTISSGNLKCTSGTTGSARGTFWIDPTDTTGYYWEGYGTTVADAACFGVVSKDKFLTSTTYDTWTDADGGIIHRRGAGGSFHWNWSVGAGGSATIDQDTGVVGANNDVVGVAMKGGKLWLAVNGVWQNSGNPSAGTGSLVTVGKPVSPTSSCGSGSVFVANFGQTASPTSTATVLAYDSASGGYFLYTPPSGFKALSTVNLPVPTIAQPNNYFNAVIYSGTGATQSVLNSSTTPVTIAGFQPDLVWIKDRTSTLAHQIFDSSRLVYPYWSSNSSGGEVGTASSTGLTAFLTNGFTIGPGSTFNTSGNSYVSWLWKKSPTTDGVDIVTYTGDNTANRAISHSLGKTPAMIIVKRRDASGTNDPWVWHTSFTDQTYFATMNSSGGTNVPTGTNTPWGSSTTANFTSTVFTVTNNATNNANAAGATYVAYLFATTTGFADFGQYTGNGVADGPFVYTGFKPRYIMVKRTSATPGADWAVFDTARSTYNPAVLYLLGDTTAADATAASGPGVDFLANGFKWRDTTNTFNAAGETYLYAAFADIPFQQSAQAYNLTIASSTRFQKANTTYLERTPGVAGNLKTWTASFWYKRATLGQTYVGLFPQAGTVGSAQGLNFNGSDQLDYDYTNNNVLLTSTEKFRDPSHWYHIVVVQDTTQATASNRMRIWVDNREITSWGTDNRAAGLALNSDQSINNTLVHDIGVYSGGSHSNTYIADGYWSDVYLVDGQALTPSSFGEYDTNGYWRPKSYGGTYGTNGFHLPLMGTTTAASVGTDTSGNGNYWTVNGITTTDFVTDSPTKDYATFSPIASNAQFAGTKGNLFVTETNNGSNNTANTTFGVSSGKWYWEMTPGTSNSFPGVTGSFGQTENTTTYTYRGDSGVKRNNGSETAYGSSFTTTDVVGVALDLDNGKIFFAKDCTWQNSGDPAAGTNAAFTGLSGVFSPTFMNSGTVSGSFQFGQLAYATSTATANTYNSSAGGYFYCTPPTGFKALSTANLPTPSVTKPNNYFDAAVYTGTGATKTVNVSTFTPVQKIYLTSGTSFTVPNNWGNASNTVEVIGGAAGGCAGDTTTGGGGGGGGAYSIKSNLSLTAGASVTYAVGSGGSAGVAGGDTYFNGASVAASSVGAKGGGACSTVTGGTGGASGSGVGDTKYSGGDGGSITGGATQASGRGGGGAGGPSGTGGAGVSTAVSSADGGGGGGNGGGSAGSGVNGGNNAGGTGGGLGGNSPAAGTVGGGGGGGSWRNGVSTNGAAGGPGTDIGDGTVGSGGGGGGGGGDNGGTGGIGGAGGSYGGGGAGGGWGSTAGGAGGAGTGGIIVITYSPAINFQPDLVWIKDRTTTNAHGIFDSARSVYSAWASSAASPEGASGGTGLTAFLTNGFTLGASTTVNTLSDNYVAWLWKKSPTTDGVDIVTYTGDNTSDRTISHSLGKNPDFVIVKRRDASGTNDAWVWHEGWASATSFQTLSSTADKSTTNTPWGTAGWTSTTFMVTNNATNNANASGATYVAYLMASTTQFSSFGTYTGNGAADGPFVYTGFKPRWILIKVYGTTGGWYIWDTARDTYNPAASYLFGDTTAADSSATNDLDVLSNGFKLRVTTAGINASSGTFEYAAFADIPFYYSAQPPASVASTFVQAVTFLIGMVF